MTEKKFFTHKNKKIELKSIEDSFASAANYVNKIGWKKKN